MSFKKNFIICSLLVVMLIFCVSAVSASEDSLNMTSDSSDDADVVAIEDNVTVGDSDENVLSDDDNTIYVDASNTQENPTGTKENPYSDINDAFNSVSNGGIIFVKNGEYSTSSPVISVGCSLVGESSDGVILNFAGTRFDRIFFNQYDQRNNPSAVSITNITFIAKNNYGEIRSAYAASFTMQDCSFYNLVDKDSVYVSYTPYSKIQDCQLSGKIEYHCDNDAQWGGSHIIDHTIFNQLTVGQGTINKIETIVNVTNSIICNASSSRVIVSDHGARLTIKNSKIENATCENLLYSSRGETLIESCIIENCVFKNLIEENQLYDTSINNINYNVFNNVDVTGDFTKLTGSNTNLDYDWWGTNEKVSDIINNWVCINPSSKKEGDNVVVSGDVKYTDGENFTAIDNPVFDKIKISLVSSNNNLDTVVNPENGHFEASFIPNGDLYIIINDELILPSAVIYVDSSFEGEESGTIDNPYKNITYAISKATGDETIFVKNGVYSEELSTITKSLNIIGESDDGVIITGGNNGIFNFLTFVTNDIYFSLTNITFKDIACIGLNTAISVSPAVKELNIIDCTFDNCSGQYGSLSIGSAEANIVNCDIINSKTTAKDGGVGAIYFYGEGDYTIENTIIDGTLNVEDYMYAVIYNDDAYSNLIMDNVFITNTKASMSIINSKGFTIIRNSQIRNNTLIKPEEFTTNIFYFADDEVIIDNVIIVDNIANYMVSMNNANVELNNSFIINNKFDNLTEDISANSNISLNEDIIINGITDVDEYIYKILHTIYVDCNFEGVEKGTILNPFRTVDNALNNVIEGKPIFIRNGVYNEQLNNIPDNIGLSLVGESADNVIINIISSSQKTFNNDLLSFVNLTFNGGDEQNNFIVSGNYFEVVNCTFTNFISSVTTIPAIFDVSCDIVDISNSKLINSGWNNIKKLYGIIKSHKGIVNLEDVLIENIRNNNPRTNKDANSALLYGVSFNLNNVTFSNIVLERYSFFMGENNFVVNNSYFVNNDFGDLTLSSLSTENLTIENSIFTNNSDVSSFLMNDNNHNFNVNHCAFFNNNVNNYYFSKVTDLNYNWYGTNDASTLANDPNVLNWVILDAYYDDNDIILGDEITITATLNTYMTSDGQIFELPRNLPDGIPITFTLPNGNVTAFTKDGKVSIQYIVTSGDNIIVKSDNAEVIVPITLKTLRIVLEDNYTATEDADITILAPGINATVEIIIDGKRETIDIINGTAVKTIENIKAGTHSVVVIYNDGTIFDFDSKSFTVDKLSTEINLEDVTVNVGETVPVEFTIASDATGRVFIDVSGKKSIEYLEDGSLSIDLDLAIGNYTVTLYYEGDDKYDACDDSFKITVNGFNADLKANASDIKVGENAIIDIEINENATGATNVILGDLIIPVTFTDGKATVSIPDLANGTYTATVKFAGDSIFLAAETTVTFTVSKEELPSDINITIDIPEGTTAPEFTVNLPSDATGNFSVTIDNQTYSQPLVNGSATVKVPEQTPGNHTISTAYSGDGKYDGFTSPNSTFNVPKASIPGGENAINMTTPSDSATPSYSIKLPADAKGNLTVTVDGKNTYSKELVNGSATVTVPELPAGKHNITVTYTGDAKYSSISKNTTVNVPEKAKPAPAKPAKVATKITAKNKKFKASKKVKKYTITLKAKGKPVKKVWVTLKVKGKTYKAKTNAKGKATFKIKKLTKKGKYKATIKFAGNKNYKASSKKVKITIK